MKPAMIINMQIRTTKFRMGSFKSPKARLLQTRLDDSRR